MPAPQRESWKEAENELFRLFVENVSDYAIFVVDSQGRVQSWNPGAERLLGYHEGEIIGHSAEIFFTPEDIQRGIPQQELREALETGRSNDDRWHVRKDGSRFWSGGTTTPLRDERGNVRGFAKIMRDLTEWKLRENAVEEQARLTAFSRDVSLALTQNDALPDMLRHCAEAVVRRLDGAFARIWTLNREENVLELQASAGMYTHLNGRHSRVPVGEYKIGLIAQERQPHLTNSVIGDPRVSDQEWAIQQKMVAFAGYPLIVDDRVVGVMAMFTQRPLTEATLEAMASVANSIAVGIERRRAETAVREQREWLRVTLSSIGDAVIATDIHGRVIFLNAMAQTLTGWPEEEAQGQPLEVVFPIFNEQTRQPAENPAAKVLREGRVVGLANHTVLRTRDGSERPIDDSAAPIRTEEGDLVGVVLVFRDISERRRLEEELRANEERYRRISETAHDGIWLVDAEARTLFLNRRMAELLGCQTRDVLGRRVTEFCFEEDIPLARERIETNLRGGTEQFDFRFRRPDGAEVLVLACTSPMTDVHGRVIGALGMFSDITARKRAEEALREAQRRFQMVFNQSYAFLGVMEPDGTLIEANDAPLQASGLTREQVLGRPMWETPWWSPSPEEQAILRADIAQARAAGPMRRESTYFTASGDTRVVDRTITPIRDEAGRVILLLASGVDITERKRAEEAVREREEWLRTTLASIGDAVIATDAEGRVSFLNPVAETLTGWPQEEAHGKALEDVFVVLHEQTRQPVKNPVARVIREGVAVGLGNHTVLIARDGTERPIDDSAAPIRRDTGETVGVVLIFRDVTEQRRAEQALREHSLITETLHRVGTLLAAELDLERIVQVVTDEGAKLTGAQFGAFFYNAVTEQGEAYTLYTLSGVPREAFADFPLPRNTAIFAPTFHGEAVVRLDDVTQDSRYGKNAPYFGMPPGHLPVRSYLAVPVVSRSGEVLGGLFFGHSEAGIFSERHERILVGVAAQAAIAIDNSRLYERTQDSEERFRQLAEHIEDVFWMADPHKPAMLYISPAYEAVWGRSRRDLYEQPRSFLDAVHLDDRQRVFGTLERQARGETTVEEYRIIRPDGSVRWVLDRAFPIRDAEGQVYRVAGIAEDITERKQAEQDLQYQHQLLRAITENATTSIFMMDERSRCEFMNPAAEAMTGYTLQEARGQILHDLIHHTRPDGSPYPMPECPIDRALPEGFVVHDHEDLFVRKNGAFFPVLCNARPIIKEGKPVGTVIEVRDVTLEKQAEAALRESEAYFRDLTQNMPIVVWTNLPDGRVDFVNRRWLEFTGQTLEHVQSAPEAWMAALHPDDREWAGNIYLKGVRSGRGFTMEARFRRASDNSYRWHLNRAEPLRDVAGNIVKFLGTCTDIEDLKRLEAELREADRRKDEFLAMLAHELRNPLAPIRSGLDVLAIEMGGGSETIELMRQQVEHLVRLVDDLLDVSRIIRGRVELRREPVELSAIIERSVDALRPAIEDREQELIVSEPQESIWLDADAVRLVQVIENLLNNASKYTDTGGRIELIAERRGDQAVVIVQDNGIGIEPDLLPKVFDLFTQSNRTLDRSQGGLGIGLTLVKNLVELHGGSVAAYSEGSGKGSRFVVHFPVATPHAESPEQPTRVAPTEGRRILVVDDNVGAAKMLSLLVSRLGPHKIETAHDGPSAVRKAERFKPDIMLLDIGLPGMDGLAVARKLRESDDLNGTLLVALTGYGQAEDRQRSREAGFDEHLVKPVDVETLRQLLCHRKLLSEG